MGARSSSGAVRYTAFLRAVNVGGRNPVPMADLARQFAALGFGEVKTFLQSGNVAFVARGTTAAVLERKVTASLQGWLKKPVVAMVRSLEELGAMVDGRPFGAQEEGDDLKLYVAFLAGEPEPWPPLPVTRPREGLELFAGGGRDGFLRSRRVQGRYGFPNDLVEKATGLPATTRNWNTVVRIVNAYRK